MSGPRAFETKCVPQGMAGPVATLLPVVKPRPDLIDVVVAASTSLAFLSKWHAVLAPYHLIVIQTGSTPLPLAELPAELLDVELHTVSDAQQRLGNNASVVIANGQLSYVYGYLVSKKQYVYTIGACVRCVFLHACHACNPHAS